MRSTGVGTHAVFVARSREILVWTPSECKSGSALETKGGAVSKPKIPVLGGRRSVLVGASFLLTIGPQAYGQSNRAAPLLGVLVSASQGAFAQRLTGLRQGLRAYGYEEPRSIELMLRYADGEVDRLPSLARELVSANPSAIVVNSTSSLRAAMAATSSIPIVVISASDVVASGLVSSLSRPGANVTGFTLQRLDLGPKEVELVMELFPRLKRLAVLRGPAGGAGALVADGIRDAAASRGVEAVHYPVSSIADINVAFAAMTDTRIGCIYAVPGPYLATNWPRVADAAAARRIAIVTSTREYVEAGALASFGPDFNALTRGTAYFVDRILKGTAPADLPVQQPTKFSLVINLKAARAIGLTLPPTILLRADEVIE